MQKAVVFTLGCKVNEVESASLISGLRAKGFEVTDKLEPADLYVLNTCAVTAEAEKKSRQLIARALKFNPQAKVIVCGCASQKNAKSFEERAGVTVVSGAQKKSAVLSLLDSEGTHIGDDEKCYDELPMPAAVKTRHFVKIQDGCNRFCTYCIIPYLRGRSRSRSIESIVEEVKTAGAEETVLTGIDISTYNADGKNMVDLLRALKDVPTRIRLGSLEISVITDELLQEMATMPDFAPHFHLSLQSGSNDVLKKMNRHYTREEYLETCNKIYHYFPDAAITTDIIVGFPTETEENFQDSLAIVEEAGFAQIHCFVFSPREGTPAAKMKQLPPEVKEVRKDLLNRTAEVCHQKYMQRFLGKVLEFVPEVYEDGYTYGYTENYIRVAVEGKVGRKCKVRLQKLNEKSKDLCIGEIENG